MERDLLGETAGDLIRRRELYAEEMFGSAALIVVGEPTTEEHKKAILDRISRGLFSWDVAGTGCDISAELKDLATEAPVGVAGSNGEHIIRHGSDSFQVEIIFNPRTETLCEGIRVLLMPPTKHKHIVFAGYNFTGTGDWVLQDSSFSFADFAHVFTQPDVAAALKEQTDSTLTLHCGTPSGHWKQDHVQKSVVGKLLATTIDPALSSNIVDPAGIIQFTDYLSYFIKVLSTEELLVGSSVVGNIRFTKPTLYIFPGAQGDCAVFGVHGFNMLIDGGYSRRACFWEFARHLDHLDVLLVSRISQDNLFGIKSFLHRKLQSSINPEITYSFFNSASGKDTSEVSSLSISLLEESALVSSYLKSLGCKPGSCHTSATPVQLYHKIGHGTLDMFVLNPSKDSMDSKELMKQMTGHQADHFSSNKAGIPLNESCSVSAMLVWKSHTGEVARILYPGSAPQSELFKSLEQLKDMDLFKYPGGSKNAAKVKKQATAKSVVPEPTLVAPVVPSPVALAAEETTPSPPETPAPSVDDLPEVESLLNVGEPVESVSPRQAWHAESETPSSLPDPIMASENVTEPAAPEKPARASSAEMDDAIEVLPDLAEEEMVSEPPMSAVIPDVLISDEPQAEEKPQTSEEEFVAADAVNEQEGERRANAELEQSPEPECPMYTDDSMEETQAQTEENAEFATGRMMSDELTTASDAAPLMSSSQEEQYRREAEHDEAAQNNNGDETPTLDETLSTEEFPSAEEVQAKTTEPEESQNMCDFTVDSMDESKSTESSREDSLEPSIPALSEPLIEPPRTEQVQPVSLDEDVVTPELEEPAAAFEDMKAESAVSNEMGNGADIQESEDVPTTFDTQTETAEEETPAAAEEMSTPTEPVAYTPEEEIHSQEMEAGIPELEAATPEPEATTLEPEAGTPELEAGTPELEAGTPEPEVQAFGVPELDPTSSPVASAESEFAPVSMDSQYEEDRPKNPAMTESCEEADMQASPVVPENFAVHESSPMPTDSSLVQETEEPEVAPAEAEEQESTACNGVVEEQPATTPDQAETPDFSSFPVPQNRDPMTTSFIDETTVGQDSVSSLEGNALMGRSVDSSEVEGCSIRSNANSTPALNDFDSFAGSNSVSDIQDVQESPEADAVSLNPPVPEASSSLTTASNLNPLAAEFTPPSLSNSVESSEQLTGKSDLLSGWAGPDCEGCTAPAGEVQHTHDTAQGAEAIDEFDPLKAWGEPQSLPSPPSPIPTTDPSAAGDAVPKKTKTTTGEIKKKPASATAKTNGEKPKSAPSKMRAPASKAPAKPPPSADRTSRLKTAKKADATDGEVKSVTEKKTTKPSSAAGKVSSVAAKTKPLSAVKKSVPSTDKKTPSATERKSSKTIEKKPIDKKTASKPTTEKAASSAPKPKTTKSDDAKTKAKTESKTPKIEPKSPRPKPSDSKLSKPGSATKVKPTSKLAPTRLSSAKSTPKGSPLYVELAYVPHHGDSKFVGTEFFQLIHARYYVFSGQNPPSKAFDALLNAKSCWDLKDSPVTIIPTYDTDNLHHWRAQNREQLGQLNIDVAPAANRCFVQLAEDNSSFPAYRLEF